MADVGLIIAAGAGTRLADHTKIPKPLRKVCGIPLLQRIILCSAKAGLKKIVVVVGFQKEQLIDFINKKKWPVEVQVVENPHWKKSNGLSVLCAKQVIDEDFILLMSDHIFDPETLANLREEKLDGLQVKLAVDYKVHQIFDKDDATKVEVQNGKIKAIAKNLVQFNAIDTGMFLLSPKIFTAFEEVKKGDDLSISDGILHLASQGLAGVFNIGNGYWQDVDTKPCLKHAEKVLMNACRKPTDGIISRNFNRHVSIFISSFLIKTPITANQVTALVLLLGLFTGYMASLGGYVNFLVSKVNEMSHIALQKTELKNSIKKKPLTKRELQVLDHVLSGLTSNSIAKQLSVTLPTIKFHLKNIYNKLGVNGRNGLLKAISNLG